MGLMGSGAGWRDWKKRFELPTLYAQESAIGVKMLLIRIEQMAVFEREVLAAFERQLTVHLRRKFPLQCQELGDNDLLDRIRTGIIKAASYDIRVQRDVARFIELMFLLCPDFDSNPAMPWTAEILNTESWLPETKMRCLYSDAQKHLELGHNHET